VASSTLAIVHDIPGRLRLRLPPGAATAGLADAVGRLAGVVSSTWSDRTRGLLVQYRPDEITPGAIVDAAADHADLDAEEHAPDASRSNGHRPTVVTAVTEVFEELDGRVVKATGGVAGLGIVVSSALALWAIAEIARGRVAPLAWSSALWYAHGLFRDYRDRDAR
jgi:hypothetical protein